MYRKEKKIPTIFALFLLMLGIGSTLYFDNSLQNVVIKAGNISKPENVRLSNITDNSFSVSWLTSEPTTGIIDISGDGIKKSLFDDLDSNNDPKPRTTHFVSVKNLKENTLYTVKIHNGSAQCKNCPAVQQKTALKLSSPLNLPPIIGSSTNKDGKPANGAIVYIVIGKSLPLSTLTDTAGLFVIPLNNLRAENLQERPKLSDNDLVQIEIMLSPILKSTAVIDFKTIRINQNIPDMKMGEQYNFVDNLSKKNSQLASGVNNILGAKTQNIPVQNLKTDILLPRDNNVTLLDNFNKPQFRGTGVPGTQLTITINSTPQSSELIVGNDGTWIFRPSKALEPGIHTVTIQGRDNNGQLVTVTRTFNIPKSGEGVVLADSTPSASLTPTIPIATATPTIILNISPTAIPTILPPTTTLIPTLITSPIPTSLPEIPPKTGDAKPLIFIGGISLALISLGVKFFFFS